MKEIPLTRGKVALVDDCDYEFLMQWKWVFNSKGYAQRHIFSAEACTRQKTCHMHRVIAERIGLEIRGHAIDHRDCDGLNNTRINLRLATRQQNSANRNRLKIIVPDSKASIGIRRSGEQIYVLMVG